MLTARLLGIVMLAGSAPDASTRTNLSHVVKHTLGASEFHGSDSIEIHEIWGTTAELKSGSSYLLRGHYRLATKTKATLLLSATTTSKERKGLDSVRSQQVDRGSGEFVFTFTIADGGYLHLTYYDADSGKPFGGVYFGQGDGVLHTRSWPYDDPTEQKASEK